MFLLAFAYCPVEVGVRLNLLLEVVIVWKLVAYCFEGLNTPFLVNLKSV